MCIRLKEEMGVENILRREQELLEMTFACLSKMTNVTILQANARKRLGIISFIVKGAHYNLIVKLLNDKFGVQARGGCSCAGTYGHHLLNVDEVQSHEIWSAIHSGDFSSKPGWIRISLHPTMTDREIQFIMNAIDSTVSNFKEWMTDYFYDAKYNEYLLKKEISSKQHCIESWFKFPNKVKGDFNAKINITVDHQNLSTH
jgi:selenocysteine lyase/cysteine desulfurase